MGAKLKGEMKAKLGDSIVRLG